MTMKPKLLVVEDEPSLLIGIRDILEIHNYGVVAVSDGREALKHLEESTDAPPDLILSDIMMPYMDGLELLQEVRKQEQWVSIPFIFMTAKGEKADINNAKYLGVDDYLVKPFDADELLIAVQAKLRRHEALNQVQANVISNVKRSIMTILHHEFRTPITFVTGFADLLRDSKVEEMGEDELLMFLREINSGADRLRILVENFITLVELETGDAQRSFNWRKHKVTHLRPLIQQAHDRIFLPEDVKHTCEIVGDDEVSPFVADDDYLVTMLRQLLENAVKFSQPDQPITIRVESTPEEVRINVIDQGRGIKPEELEHIWDAFYQINRQEFEDQGSGSGLAIVKGLCALHNADIEVESTYGEGSCFRLIFPVVTESERVSG